MLDKLRWWLQVPEAGQLQDLDNPNTTLLHRAIIERKPFLQNIYADFYAAFQKNSIGAPPGIVVECGSGAGSLKRYWPEAVTTDVQFLPFVDLCCRADRLPFLDDSVACFLMLNVFHHVKDAAEFLRELSRCLKPGGRIVMIEPANSSWGRFVYRNFHHETFDSRAGWTVAGEGPMSDANGALPWIVFQRDRGRLEQEFPGLRLVTFQYHTPLRYILSGGMTLRQLAPTWMYPVVKGIEWVLTPLSPWLGMFATIVLEKTDKG